MRFKMGVALLISGAALVVSLLIVLTYYLLGLSSLAPIRKQREALRRELESLRLKLASSKEALKPSKDVGLKFVNLLSDIGSFEITQVSETSDSIVVSLKVNSEEVATALRAFQDNYPMIHLLHLSLEPLKGDEVFMGFAMRSYEGNLRPLKRSRERAPWLTPKTFKEYLIAKGILREEKEEPERTTEREETPPVPASPLESLEKTPSHTLEELTAVFQESYKLRGVLLIGDKGVAILERVSDGKYLRLSKGDVVTLYIGSDVFKLKLKRLRDTEVTFSSSLGDVILRVK